MTTARWTAPRDVAGVVARMRALAALLPPRDGVAVFNRVYLTVTEEVTRRLAAGRFPDAPEVSELTVVFAGRYLAAVEGAGGAAWGAGAVPACWRPLVRSRADPSVHPIQFALAGITAHVGHDLALAVVDTCRATGREPASVAADYAEVGEVLTAIEVRVREELMPGPDLLERLDPLTHAVGCWSLDRARGGAWAAARLLWSLRERPQAYRECATELDGAIGLMARALLAPLVPHPAARPARPGRPLQPRSRPSGQFSGRFSGRPSERSSGQFPIRPSGQSSGSATGASSS